MTKSIEWGDYVLKDGGAWLEVKGFAVWVRATDEGVVVDIFKNGDEHGESLASAYAFDSEVENDSQ